MCKYKFKFLGIDHEVDSSWEPIIDRYEEDLKLIEFSISKSEGVCPRRQDIFNVFDMPIDKVNVVILGQDPYPTANSATGYSFEVRDYTDWNQSTNNRSLTNILKELYFCHKGSLLSIGDVRREIRSKNFDVFSPNVLFEEWRKRGVFLLNTALTCESGKPNSHIFIWNCFIRNVIVEISKSDKEVIWLLWGENARRFKQEISFFPKNSIFENPHPSKAEFVGSNVFYNTIPYTVIKN